MARFFNPMKPLILVTGSNGQLGRTLQEKANAYPNFSWVFLSRKALDITNKEALKTAFSKYRPHYCINTAAFTHVAQAEKTPELAFEINHKAVLNLAETCRLFNTKLLHLSTDFVFDGKSKTPYVESDFPNPINAYGKSKRLGEEAILERLMSFYIVRTSWLYSKKHGNNFYKTILKKATNGDPLSVVNDQYGCPTSTVELSDFLMALIQEEPAAGIYHFAGKKTHSWYSFAEEILIENQIERDIKPIPSPKEGVKRPRFSALATEKKTNK